MEDKRAVTTQDGDFTDPYGSTWRHDSSTGKWSRWDQTSHSWVGSESEPPGYNRAPAQSGAPQTGREEVERRDEPARPKKKRHVLRLVLGLLALFILLVIVLPIALIGGAAKHVSNEQQKHAITQSQFDSVKLGISRAQLHQELGKPPENSQQGVNQSVGNSGQINHECDYYPQRDQSFSTTRYQFCFTNDSLTSKNKY